MTWLDLGNGWRNLFLLSCAVQMAALGLLCASRRWFGKTRLGGFLSGVAATPLMQYLWMLLTALLWPHAPRIVLIGMPPLLAVIGLGAMLLRRIRRLKEVLKRALQFAKSLCRLDKPAVAALAVALCVIILLAPVCVRFMSSMESAFKAGDAGEYLALGQRYCEDRSLANLLEKEETVGHFRGHSHFPSLELYMSYGLMHTGGEVGYPNDKPVFTGLGLLTFYMIAAYLALLLHFCGGRLRWVFLGIVLLNLVPELFHSVAGAPRDIWRILALLEAVLFFASLDEKGNWKRYLLKLFICFAACFTVMSTHVVCFVVLPFIVAAWVIWRFLTTRLQSIRGAGKALVRSLGLALSGAAGTLLAFGGNIWCYLKWGEMSPWRLMTTYTDAPWYNMYMDIDYKLDETTTHLNFLEAKDSILMSYATPAGIWGMRAALALIVCAAAYAIWHRVRMRRQAASILLEHQHREGPTAVFISDNGAGVQLASQMLLIALTALLTLAPMTGVLDSPMYSFSGSFLKLPRYTLQWFMLANVASCAALSSLEYLWPFVLNKLNGLQTKLKGVFRRCAAAIGKLPAALPAWLCVILCILGFVKGTNQTGYTNTFYRSSRDVMENETILMDNGFRNRYGLLMELASHVPEDEKILITRVGYQYALRGKAYLLTANPIVPLMNLSAAEVEPALKELNAAMLATEPDFWDKRYYALSTLDAWFSTLPEEQIIENEYMRIYIFDRSLIPYAQEYIAKADGE